MRAKLALSDRFSAVYRWRKVAHLTKDQTMTEGRHSTLPDPFSPVNLRDVVHIDDVEQVEVSPGIVRRSLTETDTAQAWLIDFAPGTMAECGRSRRRGTLLRGERGKDRRRAAVSGRYLRHVRSEQLAPPWLRVGCSDPRIEPRLSLDHPVIQQRTDLMATVRSPRTSCPRPEGIVMSAVAVDPYHWEFMNLLLWDRPAMPSDNETPYPVLDGRQSPESALMAGRSRRLCTVAQ